MTEIFSDMSPFDHGDRKPVAAEACHNGNRTLYPDVYPDALHGRRTRTAEETLAMDGDTRRWTGRDGGIIVQKPLVPAGKAQLCLKRAIDIAVSALALAILLPVLLILAALIRVESKGPALFRQTRIGRNGVPFGILKFRSMHADRGDPSGRTQTLDDDDRITTVGRILRKSNLDELPQLWNVLVGDMSLVGPRPHVPDMIAAGKPYEDLVIGYHHRHILRPGLTGLAQSRGLRGPTSNRWKAIRRIVCDIEYIRTVSITLDAKIIIRTIITEIKGGTGS